MDRIASRLANCRPGQNSELTKISQWVWAGPQPRFLPIPASAGQDPHVRSARYAVPASPAMNSRRSIKLTELLGAHSPWPRPFAPPTPRQIALPCSPASQLLWPRPTSHARASSATAPRLPDADRRREQLPDVGYPRFQRDPFARDVLFDPGRTSMPRKSREK
jgi:hypothetical protein